MPEPESPIREMVLPFSKEKEKSLKAWLVLKALFTFLTSKNAMGLSFVIRKLLLGEFVENADEAIEDQIEDGGVEKRVNDRVSSDEFLRAIKDFRDGKDTR